MKSILVPIGGSDSDRPVFDTALAVARLFSSHLQFVHIWLTAGQAAANMPHVAFARGPALLDALGRLEVDTKARSTDATRHVHEFCTGATIDLRDSPTGAHGVTANPIEEKGDARRRLVYHARHHDLVVMGRAKRPNGLLPDLIETLLLGCGRPIMLATSSAPRNLAGTVMVCWRETPDAARAVTAAMPFLTRAERVVFVGVAEKGHDATDELDAVAGQFARCGVPTEAKIIVANGRPIADTLSTAAHNCGADLIVKGAYGHSRMREVIFGGCTQAIIAHSDRPVLLLH